MTAPVQLSGDPAQWMRDQALVMAATPHPPEGREYVHGEECRSLDSGPPAWELVNDVAVLWQRRCMQLHCGVVQYWTPTVPPRPPRPTEAELAAWVHSRDEHPCPNVQPVLEPFQFEVTDRARGLGHWRTKCRLCGSSRHFVAEAQAHYVAIGAVEPPQAPSGFRLDQISAPDPIEEQKGRFADALRQGLDR